MESSSPLQGLVRRKWLAIGAVVIILAGVMGIMAVIRPSYKATATLLLTPPALSAEQALALKDPGSQNPVLSFSDSLNVLASITVSALANDSQLKSAASQNHATYSLQTQTGTPSIAVSATAKNPDDAKTADAAITKIVQSDIAARQTALGAPAATLVHATVITPGGRTSPINSKRTKLLLIWVALSAAISLWIISTVDKRKAGGRSRAEGSQYQSDGPQSVTEPAHPPIEEPAASGLRRQGQISPIRDNNLWLPANGSTGEAVRSGPASSVVRPMPMSVTRPLSRSFGPPRGAGFDNPVDGPSEPPARSETVGGNEPEERNDWPPTRERTFPGRRRPLTPPDAAKGEIRITRPSTPD